MRLATRLSSLRSEQPAGAPKPPVKKKQEGPKPTDAGNHPLVKKLKSKFGDAIGDASEFIAIGTAGRRTETSSQEKTRRTKADRRRQSSARQKAEVEIR